MTTQLFAVTVSHPKVGTDMAKGTSEPEGTASPTSLDEEDDDAVSGAEAAAELEDAVADAEDDSNSVESPKY